jgi:hypothetical protein
LHERIATQNIHVPLFRNQQVRGSNPRVGSKGKTRESNSFPGFLFWGAWVVFEVAFTARSQRGAISILSQIFFEKKVSGTEAVKKDSRTRP